VRKGVNRAGRFVVVARRPTLLMMIWSRHPVAGTPMQHRMPGGIRSECARKQNQERTQHRKPLPGGMLKSR
jgi:hypothetical protein